MKDRFAETANGTPMECPPPSTKETVGFLIPEINSAIAKPASTSPPTVSVSYTHLSLVFENPVGYGSWAEQLPQR